MKNILRLKTMAISINEAIYNKIQFSYYPKR